MRRADGPKEWLESRWHAMGTSGLIIAPSRAFLRRIYAHNVGRNGRSGKCTVTLSFDCDLPRDIEALPGLVSLLAEFGITASFAVVGAWVERHAAEHLKLVDYGHEIVNHTYSHPNNPLLSPDRRFRDISFEEKRVEIDRCHEVCARILRTKPVGFRVPHFKRLFTPEIYNLLKELGYRYSSSTCVTDTRSHGNAFIADHGIIEFPLSVCPAHPFTAFDTWHSLNTRRLAHRLIHRSAAQYCDLFHTLLDIGEATKSYINVYLDPGDVPKINGFAGILERLSDKDRFWVATYQDLIGQATTNQDGIVTWVNP